MRVFTAREEALLRELCSFRFLTHRQITELLFGHTALRPGSRETSAWRVIRDLRQRGLLTTNALQAGEPDASPTRLVYFLTPHGHRLLARSQPGLRRSSAPRGALLVAHSLMVVDIALAFRRSARSRAGHELRVFECDWEVARWLVGSRVVPDAYLRYTTAHHQIRAFVEADRGTEGTKFFRGKIERYCDLHRRGGWQERGDPATPSRWPLILTVTRTVGRAVELRRSTEAVLQRLCEHGICAAFRFAALDDLRQRGPFAEIWTVAGRDGAHPIVEVPAGQPPLIADTAAAL